MDCKDESEGEGLCQFEGRLIKCETLRDKLLLGELKSRATQASKGEMSIKGPSDSELSLFISKSYVSDDVPASRILASLLLLYTEDGGRKFFELPLSAEDKSRLLSLAVTKKLLTTANLKELRSFIYINKPSISDKLAFELTKTDDDFPATPFLFERLSASDTSLSTRALKTYSEMCQPEECKEFFDSILESLVTCERSFDNAGCDFERFRSLPLSAQQFLGRSQIRILQKSVGHNGPLENKLSEPALSKYVIRSLARVDYSSFRSVELLDMFSSALEKLVSLRSQAIFNDLLNPTTVDMFVSLAAHDSKSKNLVSKLFSDRAEYLIRSEKENEARYYLEKSFDVSGEPLESRDRLIKRDLLSSDPEKTAEALALKKKHRRPISLSKVLPPTITLLSLFGAAVLAHGLFKKEPLSTPKPRRPEDYNSKLDLARKQGLLESFNLTPEANLAELEATYRRLAKQYHPDLHKGSSEKFVQINENYRLLKKLM